MADQHHQEQQYQVETLGNVDRMSLDKSSEHLTASAASVDSDASHPHSEKHEEGKNGTREGDWLCLVCGANVFGRNISCYRCASPKPGTNARHGDWVCLNKTCGAHNYASRQNCYRCHVLKGAEKPGDWPCPNCHSNNFASRTECFRCRIPRPPGFAAGMYGSIRPGDWLCPNPTCGSNVFANRDTCFRCNTPRPADAEVASSFSDMRIGDWTCSNCGAMCYANRTTCFRCEAPKPDDVSAMTMAASMAPGIMITPQAHGQIYRQQYSYYPVGYNPYAANSYYTTYYQAGMMNPAMMYHQYRQREGDWICIKCNQTNFARRTECFKCKAPRTDGGSQDGSLPENSNSGHGDDRPDTSQSATEVNAQS